MTSGPYLYFSEQSSVLVLALVQMGAKPPIGE